MLALGMDFARRLTLGNSHLRGEQSPHQVPAIMLVDEIELHLHPAWQQRVLADLQRAFPETQFIVTTHSAPILTTVPDECIRILEEGRVHAAPPGTEGAEVSRVLKRILGVDVRPPENQATRELEEYLALVDADQWQSPRALELRKQLDTRYQGEEPALLEADLRIENRKWELAE
jgi:predicted ATP-binding protein involved in virulence